MVFFVQLLSFIIFHFPFKFFLRAKVEGVENLKLDSKRPLILVSNHQAKIDPFLILLLPYRLVRQIIPFYQPTGEYYYKKWWFKPFILYGAYLMKQRAWTIEELLGPTLEKLHQGKSIMIFPEGQLVKERGEVKAKPGVFYLAKESGAQILPIHIEGVEGLTFRDFIFRRRTVAIRLAKPFIFNTEVAKSHYKELAHNLIESIYDL